MKFTHHSTYANLLPRYIASQVDAWLLGLPTWYAMVTLASSTSWEQLVTGFIYRVALVFLPMSLVSFVYGPYCLSRWGQTAGKAVVGVCVVADKKESLLTFKAGLFRELMAKPISFALFGLGFWAVLFDPQHQGWHDQLAGSYVVKSNTRLLVGVAALLILVALHGVIGYQGYVALVNNPSLQNAWSMAQEAITQFKQ